MRSCGGKYGSIIGGRYTVPATPRPAPTSSVTIRIVHPRIATIRSAEHHARRILLLPADGTIAVPLVARRTGRRAPRRFAGLLNPLRIVRRQLCDGGRRRWCYVLDGGQLADLRARAVSRLAGEEATVRPEDTLREAGISTKRQTARSLRPGCPSRRHSAPTWSAPSADGLRRPSRLGRKWKGRYDR